MRFTPLGCFRASALLGVAVLLVAAGPGRAQITFSNNAGITIPDSGAAAPYPSNITVSGYTGPITNITVTLTGYSHTYTDDVGAILTGPGGQKTILFDGAGLDNPPGTSVSNITLTFSDAAAAPLPDNADFGSGTFKPGQNQYGAGQPGGDVFDAPAPAGPYATDFSAFLGADSNGSYSLYVEDFVPGDSGSITGWSVTLSGITPAPEPGLVLGICAAAAALGGAVARRVRRRAQV